MDDFKLKAIDPKQYDSPELDWRKEGDMNSKSRLFFRNNLRRHLENLDGKTIVDIGSGIGHLFPMLFELGAKEIYGIEPSKRNVQTSKRLYPEVEIFEGSIEDYNLEKKFDVAISIMVFEHILDIDSAFQKISNLLNKNGRFYFIFGDKDFFTTTRPEAKVEIQTISENSVSTKTTRPTGVMYDIIRSKDIYFASLQKSDFRLVSDIGLFSEQSRHSFHKLKPICHLLILEKI
jgi:2-polyprenyl-3-methyl-5-hydroxy-6-metoxy-1,4-benzoquinol methylase